MTTSLDNATIRQLYQWLKGWLELLTNVDIRPQRDKGRGRPSSAKDVIGVRVSTRNERLSPGDERYVAMDGSVTLRGERRSTFQLTGYGDTASAAIDALEASRHYPEIETYLDAQGVAVEDIGGSLEQNAQYEGEWETRSFRDLSVNYIEETTFPAGSVVTARSVVFGLDLVGDAGLDELEADVTLNAIEFSSAFSTAFATEEALA